jgi:3-oxoacyl-[acyl-carrier-protein] synthase II
MTTQPVTQICAWSATSPFGHGRAAFAGGVLAGVPAPAAERTGDWFAEPDTAHVVPDFDIVDLLGRKGTGSMDRTTALAVSTVGRLCKDDAGTVVTDERTGVVLGTTSGSTQTQFAFTADSLTRRKPYFVNPAQMPFALMNSAAAQCASWHGLTGPNTTVAAGRLAGIATLRYADRLLRTGRASAVFAGAVEEYGDARTLLERRRGNTARLGEGAAVLYLRPGGGNRSALAEVVALDTRLAVAGEPRDALAGCLRRVLAGVAPHEVWGMAPSGPDPALERDVVCAVLGREVERVVVPAELVGDTGAATGAFQVAALLALGEAEGEGEAGRGRLAVATAVDRDGMVGCVVVRLLGGSGNATQVRGSSR